MSLMFCINADGSDKRTPTVIGTFAKSRRFKSFSPALYVIYESHKKAWMTAALFQKWLKNFNSEMGKNKCNILLISDNAPRHKTYPMSNVFIAFLPPDCTRVLQPLDAAIVQSFKAYYGKHQICHIIEKNQ